MDFNAIIGMTDREVYTGERNGKPTHIVRVQRSYATSPTDLWDALTQPKRLQRWFAQVTGDLKLGGEFSVKGNASGEILTCTPPNFLVLTWVFGGSASWVSIEITEDKKGALLTLTHELPTDPQSEAHWQKYGPGATGVGWEWSFLGLDGHLLQAKTPLLEAGEAWAMSTQGKATLRTWAMAWGQADACSGSPEQMAKEAAKRTAAFYAGVG